jgi:hypothetical protein
MMLRQMDFSKAAVVADEDALGVFDHRLQLGIGVAVAQVIARDDVGYIINRRVAEADDLRRWVLAVHPRSRLLQITR